MIFNFDLIKGNEVRSTINGLEIIRPVYVKELSVESGATDPAVLLKIITDPQCPQLGDLFPKPEYAEAILEEHRLRTIDGFRRSAYLDLVYRATPVPLTPGTPIQFEVEQSSQQVTVTTYSTSDGHAITIWYKKGESAGTQTFPTGGIRKGAGVTKVQTYDVLRAVGRATKVQWNAIKASIRSARGKINEDPWGGAGVGTYLFLGPTTRSFSKSKAIDISLDFLGDPKGHYPLVAYFDEHGEHPADSAEENDIRGPGVPSGGGMYTRNGLTLASIYEETTFSPLFGFTPDD